MTPKEVLIEARRLIAENGWVQGHAGNCLIGLCSVGAMSVAEGSEWVPAARALFRRANNITLWGDDAIAVWNDAKGRTKEDVLAAFDRAIELASQAQVDCAITAGSQAQAAPE